MDLRDDPVQQGTWLRTRVQGVLIHAACSHIIGVKWISRDPRAAGDVAPGQGTGGCSYVQPALP
jgi:hypothetical protein